MGWGANRTGYSSVICQYVTLLLCRALATTGGFLTYLFVIYICFSTLILFVKISKKASKQHCSSFFETVKK